MATFDRVQERLKTTGYAPERKNTGEDFALRGFATCGDCNAPLRSSWSKGKYKSYPYYACHTKGCDSYGKSIPRDKLECAFGEIVKTLEPSPKLFALTKAMFRQAWDARLAQAKDTKFSAQRQIVDVEKQIETMLGRIMNATNDSVIGAYENKLNQLEKDKARMRENVSKNEPKAGRLEEMIELSLKLLSSPWKIWESGDNTLRTTLLRLAFTEGFAYHRNEGHRTPKIALPFKALGMFSGGKKVNGAAGEDRTPDLVITNDALYH
jgi:site-specific DNA recombinase